MPIRIGIIGAGRMGNNHTGQPVNLNLLIERERRSPTNLSIHNQPGR